MPLSFRRWVVSTIILIELGLFCFQIYLALWAPEFLTLRVPDIDNLAMRLDPFWPALNGYIAHSSFPNITSTFYVISALILPVQILIFAMFNYVSGRLPGAPRLGARQGVGIFILLIVLCFSLLFLPNDLSLVGSHGPSSSRVWLAFFGTGQFVCVWIMAGLLVGELLIFIRERFFGK